MAKEVRKIAIRRMMVPQYLGLSAAAKRLGVSATQVKRHISGEQPSMRLARQMRDKGVYVVDMIDEGMEVVG